MKNISVIVLAVSNMVAPALSFLALPFLANFYSPELFGEYFFIFSAATVLSLLMTLTLHQGIISENTQQSAVELFFECVVGSLFVCMTFISLGCGIAFLIQVNVIPLIAACMLSLFFGWGQMSLNLLARFKAYKIYSSLMICRALLASGLQVLLAFLGIIGWEVLCGSVILGEVAVFFGVIFALRLKNFHGWQFNEIIKFSAIRKNKNFATYYMPSQLTGIGANYFPLYVMKYFGDIVGVGLYGMAIRLVGVPIGAVINSLKATFWRECINLTHEEVHNTVFFRWLKVLVLGILFSLVYKLFDVKIGHFLGNQWVALDRFMIPLVLWQVSSLAAVYVVEVFKNTGKQRYIFFYELLSAIIKIVATLVGLFTDQSILFFFLWGAFSGNILSASILLIMLFTKK